MQGTLQEIQKGDKEGEGSEESRLGLDSLLPTVIITTYNEEEHIGTLLEALSGQTVKCNVVIVDSESSDLTVKVASDFGFERIKIVIKKCRRGEGRNIGVNLTESSKILFTDADAVPDSNWVECMSEQLNNYDLVSGETRQEGPLRYSRFGRVELFYGNFEITAPSMNLAVRRDIFLKSGGFDPRLVTAEDIDLNLRIVRKEASATKCSNCKVKHNTRERFVPFMKQAFWNGYGRAQLRYKNKEVWNKIEKGKIRKREIGFIWIMRNASAVTGYILFFIKGRKELNSHHPLEDRLV